jgi:hypothetical protein
MLNINYTRRCQKLSRYDDRKWNQRTPKKPRRLNDFEILVVWITTKNRKRKDVKVDRAEERPKTMS